MNDYDYEVRIDSDEAKAILTFMEHGLFDEIKAAVSIMEKNPASDGERVNYLTNLLNAYQELKSVLSE